MPDPVIQSRAEKARLGLLAALSSASDLPAPSRNEGLDKALDALAAGNRIWLNLVDDDPRAIAEELGDAMEQGQLEFEVIARLELVVMGPRAEAREQVFDSVLVRLRNAVMADRTLGGQADDVRIDRLHLTQLALDGMENIKAAEIVFAVLLTASDFLAET
ncbi:MAG: hypothetical protein ACXIVO_13710 [Glycocaulis sp.]